MLLSQSTLIYCSNREKIIFTNELVMNFIAPKIVWVLDTKMSESLQEKYITQYLCWKMCWVALHVSLAIFKRSFLMMPLDGLPFSKFIFNLLIVPFSGPSSLSSRVIYEREKKIRFTAAIFISCPTGVRLAADLYSIVVPFEYRPWQKLHPVNFNIKTSHIKLHPPISNPWGWNKLLFSCPSATSWSFRHFSFNQFNKLLRSREEH